MSRQAAIDIGRTLARQVFSKRGDHSEAHISEAELAALLALAAERGMARLPAERVIVVNNHGEGA